MGHTSGNGSAPSTITPKCCSDYLFTSCSGCSFLRLEGGTVLLLSMIWLRIRRSFLEEHLNRGQRWPSRKNCPPSTRPPRRSARTRLLGSSVAAKVIKAERKGLIREADSLIASDGLSALICACFAKFGSELCLRAHQPSPSPCAILVV